MAVVETACNESGHCLLRTSVSTTGVFIIGTLREYLHLGSAPAATWADIVRWSSLHPAFSRAAEDLDALAVEQALSLNLPSHEALITRLCQRRVESELLPLFLG
ncbi:MAG: hypothetical protein JJU06_15405 [Ectothiorhodospiraceae bacterium]|nr:hypothetical protein [Ectothiorhodospiraceae bacterium]